MEYRIKFLFKSVRGLTVQGVFLSKKLLRAKMDEGKMARLTYLGLLI